MHSTAAAAVDAAVEEAPVSGVMQFQQPWAANPNGGDGEHFLGYRLGNGTTLIIKYDAYEATPPTMYRMIDADARKVQCRHREKQLDLAWLETLPKSQSRSSVSEIIYSQDLFRDVTLLPLPESQPLVPWKGEQEAMQAHAARVAVSREQWKRASEAHLTALNEQPTD